MIINQLVTNITLFLIDSWLQLKSSPIDDGDQQFDEEEDKIFKKIFNENSVKIVNHK